MQGMMSPPQSMPQPPQQGMMQPSPQSKGTPYSGPVTYDGITEQAVNGVVEHEGEKYYVSADKSMVWNEKNQVVGYLDQSGNIKPMTDEMEQSLTQSGIVK